MKVGLAVEREAVEGLSFPGRDGSSTQTEIGPGRGRKALPLSECIVCHVKAVL